MLWPDGGLDTLVTRAGQHFGSPAAAFGIISYLVGHTEFSAYLNIPYIAGTGELGIFCGALAGAAAAQARSKSRRTVCGSKP